MSVLSGRGKGAKRQRADERYRRAVGRQLLMLDRGYYEAYATVRSDGERIPIRRAPAPVEEFLRPGDAVDSCNWRWWALEHLTGDPEVRP